MLSADALKSFPSPGVNTLNNSVFLQKKTSTIFKSGEKYYELCKSIDSYRSNFLLGKISVSKCGLQALELQTRVITSSEENYYTI